MRQLIAIAIFLLVLSALGFMAFYYLTDNGTNYTQMVCSQEAC